MIRAHVFPWQVEQFTPREWDQLMAEINSTGALGQLGYNES